MTALLETNIEGFPVKRGKVRDVYDLGDKLLIVATDRISAFDYVLQSGIPDKGKILTAMTVRWFNVLATNSHLISADLKDFPEPFQRPELQGRSMLVRKCRVYPVECIVRGYLTGSAWEEYKRSGTVCGIKMPRGLKLNAAFPEPLFTPSTKAEQGEHDVNITFDEMKKIVGHEVACGLRDGSLYLYGKAARQAWENGVIIADTKFEFGSGLKETFIRIVDEVMTPDSSRFWKLEDYQLGVQMPSFDKQYVRDYLLTVWDKNSGTEPPPLSQEVIERTRDKYLEAYRMLTGEEYRPCS